MPRPTPRRIDDGGVAGDHGVGFEPLEALVRRRPGDVDAGGQFVHGQAAVGLELGKDPPVDVVERPWSAPRSWTGRNGIRHGHASRIVWPRSASLAQAATLADDPRVLTETCYVELPPEHPGFADPAYRARRDAISAVGAAYTSGTPIPDVAYAPEEDAVWRVVATELADKHQRYACQVFLDGADRLDLRRDRVPQLAEVSEGLTSLTGWRIEPVPGLVPARRFYGSLADRRFQSTQYIRHHSVPFYTPEPDVIHEVIGHANGLASERLAPLYEAAGRASARATTAAAFDFFSRVFWFTIEFGVAWEGSELRTYGAGLLSSYGELDAFRHAELRPFDVVAMGNQAYDITQYQPVLFAATSFDEVSDRLGAFFDSYSDESFERLTGRGAA